MPVLPIGGEQSVLVYGSSDGGKTVHNDDDIISDFLVKSAKRHHLAEHTVQETSGLRRVRVLHTAGDVEGHRVVATSACVPALVASPEAGGRPPDQKSPEPERLLLDLARALPPEAPWLLEGGKTVQGRRLPKHLSPVPSSIFFRQLRPEFLTRLSSCHKAASEEGKEGQAFLVPPISSDAFSAWGGRGEEAKRHNQNAMQVLSRYA